MSAHQNRKPLGAHKVGYCRPPKRKPGDSRKKRVGRGDREISETQAIKDFFNASEKEVEITINGRKRRHTAMDITYARLFEHAMKGEPWAVRRAIDAQLKLADRADEAMLRLQMVHDKWAAQQARKPDPERAVHINYVKGILERRGRWLLDSWSEEKAEEPGPNTDQPAQPKPSLPKGKPYPPE